MPKPPPTSGEITLSFVSGILKIALARIERAPCGFCELVWRVKESFAKSPMAARGSMAFAVIRLL